MRNKFPLLALLLMSVLSYNAHATITQLPGSDRSFDPQINDKGSVVWTGEVINGDREIFLFDGYNTVQITDFSHIPNGPIYNYAPQINDKNQIVWVAQEEGVYFYDDGVTQKISDIGNSPQINNRGEVVWEADGVYVYDTKHDTLKKIGDAAPTYWSSAKINEKGQVVWGDDEGNIHFYNGNDTITLGVGFEPDLNDKGDVVWIGGDLYTVQLYDGHSITSISDNAFRYSDNLPQINNRGQVLYQNNRFLLSGQTYESLAFYDNGHTTIINTLLADVGFPTDLNDRGQFVWTNGRLENSRSEIFLYDNGVITQLTSNGVSDFSPKINNKGDVVWVEDYRPGKIMYAKADNPVPEPSTLYLLGSGLIGLLGFRRKFR